MPSSRSFPTRRLFLKHAAVAAAGTLAWPLLARPAFPASFVRVQGRVQTASGAGLAGIPVTDGLSIVDADADGAFTLQASAHQPFVYLTLPPGYRIPKNAPGTARFYQALHPDASGAMQATFTLEPEDLDAEDHTFLVMADPQTQDVYDMGRFHQETVSDVSTLVAGLPTAPAFGVACGDIMYDHLDLYPEYERAVATMGLPFFQVVGNHDLVLDAFTDEASAHTFRNHFGPTYYSFNRGAAHYVVLDDVFWQHRGYIGYLDEAQLRWLAADLRRVAPGTLVVVFLHIPVHSTRSERAGQGQPAPSISVTNREALYALLEPFQAHLISGHTHEVEHIYEGGVHEYVCGAACGAWWSGPICYDGSPNGYTVFEVQGETLSWRYKATGYPEDYQLRAYTHGADPTAPDEIVANVWNWDPRWTVVWYEDGIRTGQMAPRLGTDPLSERLHRGADLPERRSWVEPAPTGHLFYAPASTYTQNLRVEVTDGDGRTYTATPASVETL